MIGRRTVDAGDVEAGASPPRTGPLAVINSFHPDILDGIVLVLEEMGYSCRVADRSFRAYLPHYTNDQAQLGYRAHAHPGIGVDEASDLKPALYVDSSETNYCAYRNGLRDRLQAPYLHFIINGFAYDFPHLCAGGDAHVISLQKRAVPLLRQAGLNAMFMYLPFMNRYRLTPRSGFEAGYYGYVHGAQFYFEYAFYLAVKRELPGEDIRVFGGRGNPDGLLPCPGHFPYMQRSIATMHFKPWDAPGFALYESLALGVPILLPETFYRNTRYDELYEDGVSCLVFPDVETALIRMRELKSPEVNHRIGAAGHARLKRFADVRAYRDELQSFFDLVPAPHR